MAVLEKLFSPVETVSGRLEQNSRSAWTKWESLRARCTHFHFHLAIVSRWPLKICFAWGQTLKDLLPVNCGLHCILMGLFQLDYDVVVLGAGESLSISGVIDRSDRDEKCRVHMLFRRFLEALSEERTSRETGALWHEHGR